MNEQEAAPMQHWLCHAYDYFVCGHDVLYVAHDGNIYAAIMITPIDRAQSQYKFVGWSSLSSDIATFTLDLYQDVLVLGMGYAV